MPVALVCQCLNSTGPVAAYDVVEVPAHFLCGTQVGVRGCSRLEEAFPPQLTRKKSMKITFCIHAAGQGPKKISRQKNCLA